MRTNLIIILSVTLSILHPPVFAQGSAAPFTATSPFYFSAGLPALKIISFDGTITGNKVLLSWTVGENQEAEQFEVERSSNGKNFKMAALIFGTDKADTDTYRFFERTKKSKISYRLKIIYKNGTIDYSRVIIAETGNRTAE
jgi:hypothetical protein